MSCRQTRADAELRLQLALDLACTRSTYSSSPTIFKSIGIKGTSTSLLTTGVFGVIKTVGGLSWCFLIVDRFGRRPILLIGATGGAIAMFAIAAYNNIADPANNPSDSLSGGGRAALAFFYIWTAFYAVSWNVSLFVCTLSL